MTADALQRFIFNQISELKRLSKLKENSSDEYQRAIKDIIFKLETDREDIIKSCEIFKKAGLLI